MFMRAMQGVLYFLDSLDQAVAFQPLFKSLEPQHAINVPHVKTKQVSTASLSKNLNVLVREGNLDIVKLKMPARSVDDLENLVPEETRQRIEEQEVNILELKAEVQRSGYLPQTIFETQVGSRNYRVWLS